jgi:hypothetical protein
MPDASTFTLGSLTLTLYDDEPDLGTPDRALGVESNALSDEPVQTTDYVSAFRTQTYPVRIVGVASIDESANDNVVRQLHNLTLELAKETNTLVLLRRGSSTPTTYQVVKNARPVVPFSIIFDRGNVLKVAVTLTVRPWAIGDAVSQVLATAADTPFLADVTVDGEEPAPLTLTITRAFSDRGLFEAQVAHVPGDAVLADYHRLAKDAATSGWANYTATYGYASGANNTRMCTSESWQTMTWDVLPVGRYRLVVRARVVAGGLGYLAQARSGALPCAAVVNVPDSGYWHLYNLGDYASDGRTALRVVGKVRESAHGLVFDWLMAVPLLYGTPTTFQCAAPAVHAVEIGWLDARLWTTAGAELSARRYVSGAGVKALGVSRLLVMASEVVEARARPPVTVAAAWTPRYTHWVPTPEV